MRESPTPKHSISNWLSVRDTDDGESAILAASSTFKVTPVRGDEDEVPLVSEAVEEKKSPPEWVVVVKNAKQGHIYKLEAEITLGKGSETKKETIYLWATEGHEMRENFLVSEVVRGAPNAPVRPVARCVGINLRTPSILDPLPRPRADPHRRMASS